MPSWPSASARPTVVSWPGSTSAPIRYNWPSVFDGNFAALFPGSYQVVQTDLPGALLYGSTPVATTGNTSTTIVSLSGVLSTVAVPIWVKSTNSASIGAGATFNVYYDGAGTTPAMTGITPTAGTPVALTGAGASMSITFTAGTSVNGNSWKATCAGLVDQSGNMLDYTQLDITAQPIVTAGVNGKPGILGDGVNDVLASACSLPAPGTTPWCGFLVARRPTTAAANARMVGDSSDSADLILSAATSIRLFNGGTFGPTATGLPTNTWGAIDFKYSNSASDYIQTGSGAVASGAGAGNFASSGRQVGAAPANIEFLMLGYAPASVFN